MRQPEHAVRIGAGEVGLDHQFGDLRGIGSGQVHGAERLRDEVADGLRRDPSRLGRDFVIAGAVGDGGAEVQFAVPLEDFVLVDVRFDGGPGENQSADLVAAFNQRVRDLFGIALVHLAAVGLDEKLGHQRAK